MTRLVDEIQKRINDTLIVQVNAKEELENLQSEISRILNFTNYDIESLFKKATDLISDNYRLLYWNSAGSRKYIVVSNKYVSDQLYSKWINKYVSPPIVCPEGGDDEDPLNDESYFLSPDMPNEIIEVFNSNLPILRFTCYSFWFFTCVSLLEKYNLEELFDTPYSGKNYIPTGKNYIFKCNDASIKDRINKLIEYLFINNVLGNDIPDFNTLTDNQLTFLENELLDYINDCKDRIKQTEKILSDSEAILNLLEFDIMALKKILLELFMIKEKELSPSIQSSINSFGNSSYISFEFLLKLFNLPERKNTVKDDDNILDKYEYLRHFIEYLFIKQFKENKRLSYDNMKEALGEFVGFYEGFSPFERLKRHDISYDLEEKIYTDEDLNNHGVILGYRGIDISKRMIAEAMKKITNGNYDVNIQYDEEKLYFPRTYIAQVGGTRWCKPLPINEGPDDYETGTPDNSIILTTSCSSKDFDNAIASTEWFDGDSFDYFKAANRGSWSDAGTLTKIMYEIEESSIEYIGKKVPDFNAIAWYGWEKKLLAGVAKNNDSPLSHLFFGFTRENRELMVSNSPQLLHILTCNNIMEIPQDSYIYGDDIYLNNGQNRIDINTLSSGGGYGIKPTSYKKRGIISRY